MKLNLEDLPHQKAALDALLDAFPDADTLVATQPSSQLAGNKASQSGNAAQSSCANPPLCGAFDEGSFIDIKMETGTGKTYVYTRAMYELYQKRGIFKFIIVVPSLAIKEGTKNFITSDYAREHFTRLFPGVKMDLLTVNAGDFSTKRGRRKTIPAAISAFVEASALSHGVIECLLLSDKGFLDRDGSMLFKDDYDQNLFGGYSCPAEGIKSTFPVVIIDEPHRIPRDKKTYNNIKTMFGAQMVLRFGATFKEYYREKPLYDLNAVEAFNQDLVKGVTVNFPRLETDKTELYRVCKATRDALVLQRKSDKQEWTISRGEDLCKAGAGFEGGVTYEGSGELSSALALREGMTLVEGVFANSYQELLMSTALDCHFKAEEENFCRYERGEGWRVKTICLFFIDSIASYRKEDGWLRQTFERLLRGKLEEIIGRLKDGEYKDYLIATRQNIAACHGGYFAEDWGKSDESAVAEEVDDILHKERTLGFKTESGKWNTRRFFFSKWTLREGWDNPNVFTICKLRSSGSETSKVQEVGRGLRLPVDEKGGRLHSSQWRLSLVVGYDEKDFAQSLVCEINASSKVQLNSERLTDSMLDVVCKAWGMYKDDKPDRNAALNALGGKGIIDFSRRFTNGGYEMLLKECPALLNEQLNGNKVVNADDEEKHKYIRLRKNNWEAIRSLWKTAAKQYMIVLEKRHLNDSDIKVMFARILQGENVFDDNSRVILEQMSTSRGDDGKVALASSGGFVQNTPLLGQMKYSAFIKELSFRTDVPISIVHECVWKALQAKSNGGASKDSVNKMINRKTLSNIITSWTVAFEQMDTAYRYRQLDFTTTVSVLQGDEFVERIARGFVGRIECTDAKDDERNLYDLPLSFDSETPEHGIIQFGCPEGATRIVAFGKLPRKAIRVPVITGGTTTPDFVYAAKSEDGKVLYMLVEAKSTDMRGKEKTAVDAQKKFFRDISGGALNVRWQMATKAEDVEDILKDFVPV